MNPSNKSTSKSQVNYFHRTFFYWMKVLNTLVLQKLLVRRQSNWINQSTEHEVMSHCGKSMNTLDIFFLHRHTASILMRFNNCWSFEHRMAKISLIQSVLWLYCDVPQCILESPRPWQNCCRTCQLPSHPQDGGYKRSTSGTPWLATTFKCEFVAQTTSLSSCEPLAGAASARGGRYWRAGNWAGSGQHNYKLLDPVCLVSATNALLWNSSAPAGCRRAGRAQAGTKQLHPTWYEHNWWLIENVWWMNLIRLGVEAVIFCLWSWSCNFQLVIGKKSGMKSQTSETMKFQAAEAKTDVPKLRRITCLMKTECQS